MRLVIARIASVFVVASILVGAGAISAHAAPQDDVVSLTNTQRSSAGVAPLTRNATLDAAAQEWANEMTRVGFEHSTNEWRAARIPAGWSTHGENIAYGYSTASSVVSGWMNSAGHRANILRSSFTHIGVGYVASGNYWVQIFAGYTAANSPTRPIGSIDGVSIQATSTSATISTFGWAIDRVNPTSAIPVHVYVTDPNGRTLSYGLTASVNRADVATTYPAAGGAHGFTFSTSVNLGGTYKICAFAIGIVRSGENNALLGCKTAILGPSAPVGAVDVAAVIPDGAGAKLVVSGWSFDGAFRAESNSTHVYVTDPSGKTSGYATPSNNSRPDVGQVFPGAGSAHGYTFATPVTIPGTYRVCVYSIGSPVFWGSNGLLGCYFAFFGPSSPRGTFDSALYDSSRRVIQARGWTFDNGLRSVSNSAHIYVTAPNGVTQGYGTLANAPRPDVAAVYPGAGDAHGIVLDVPATEPGTYKVCGYAISLPIFVSRNAALACYWVAVPRP